MPLLLMWWMKTYHMKNKKVSAAREAPGFLYYGYDDKKLY